LNREHTIAKSVQKAGSGAAEVLDQPDLDPEFHLTRLRGLLESSH